MLKILLVDDEVSVLKGLYHVFTQKCPQHEVVDTAQSGLEALQILQHSHVDVVISDVRMPEMDGIELTEAIRSQYPHITVIILSGHADFDYVRQAMKKGAYDYLLKPCRYQSILELLQKLEEQRANTELQHYRSLNQEQLLHALAGKGDVLEGIEQAAELTLVVIGVREYMDTYIEHAFTQLLDKWKLKLADLDIAHKDERLIVLFRRPVPQLGDKLHQLLHTVRKQGITLFIVEHSFLAHQNGLLDAYHYCEKMLEFLTFNEYATVLDSKQYENKLNASLKVKIADSINGKSLLRYLLHADYKNMKSFVDWNMAKLLQLDVHIDPVRIRRELICQLSYLEHEYIEQRISGQEEITNPYIDEINSKQSFRELLGWLKAYLYKLMMFIKDEELKPQYILAAKQYIERNYMESLTLASVSQTVFLNPWYFSTQFKKYMNISFGDYLNEVRIRMAKEFLKQRDLKVYQVAEMVGFQDAAYFSTVFKNLEKISPKEYQKAFTKN